MIDGIGNAGAGRLALVRGNSAERTAEIGRAGEGSPRAGAPASPVAAMAAEGAPIDGAKVAAIRAAIAEGRYPVDPARIAAAMVEIDLPLSGGR
jgi:negative regulator of flagellin synthesis FlgM